MKYLFKINFNILIPIKRKGTAVYTTVIRNGNQFSYIGRNQFYNNSYQYSINLPSPIVLQTVYIDILNTNNT